MIVFEGFFVDLSMEETDQFYKFDINCGDHIRSFSISKNTQAIHVNVLEVENGSVVAVVKSWITVSDIPHIHEAIKKINPLPNLN